MNGQIIGFPLCATSVLKSGRYDEFSISDIPITECHKCDVCCLSDVNTFLQSLNKHNQYILDVLYAQTSVLPFGGARLLETLGPNKKYTVTNGSFSYGTFDTIEQLRQTLIRAGFKRHNETNPYWHTS